MVMKLVLALMKAQIHRIPKSINRNIALTILFYSLVLETCFFWITIPVSAWMSPIEFIASIPKIQTERITA